ncbi:MAG TPA: anti-sigma factor, partial [Acidimicrobiales bacterium]
MNARIGPVAGDPMTCADARQLVHELALGTLAGDQRARLLEHIERCPACEGLAADLAGVVDSLLLLTPEADPPPGFESAVLARIASDDRRPTPLRPRRLRLRTLVVAAAAAAVLVAGTAAGTVAVRGDGGGPAEVTLPVATGQLRTAALIGGN